MLDLRNKPILLVLILVGLGLIASFSFWLIEESRIKSRQKTNLSENKPASSAKAKRIICAAPSVTEIVFALGFGGNVVGVSDFSTYPPQVKEKANIGGMFNPNRERITALQPDLVITQGKHESLTKLCRKADIRLLSVEINTLKDIPEAIFSIGQELNVENKASKLAQEVKESLEAVKSKTRGLPPRKVPGPVVMSPVRSPGV